jgi:hypothetical protein
VTDLLVADQWNAFELLQLVFYEVVLLCKETARPSFMQLAVFDMPKKQHFEKKITRRIMRSAIRLSVLDFS